MFTRNEKRLMGYIKKGYLDTTTLMEFMKFTRNTVYVYLGKIYKKLGINSMAELVHKLHTEDINTEVKWYE